MTIKTLRVLTFVLAVLTCTRVCADVSEPPMEQASTACAFAVMNYAAVAETYAFELETISSSTARERFISDFTKLYSKFGSVTPDLRAILFDSYDAGLRSARSSLKLLDRAAITASKDRKRAWYSSEDEMRGVCMFMLGRLDARGELVKVLARTL